MKRVLVLCVDRDNDVGIKTKYRTPIVGRADNLRVAAALGLSDPEESDTNAMFEAVKIADSVGKDAEVYLATVAGAESRGVEADEHLSKQIDSIIRSFKPTGAIVVTDGIGDEYVLPLIQSKVNVISVRRVIVKQSEQLEGAYYMAQKFLERAVNDPKIGRIIFGLPGLALLLFAFFGQAGWRVVLGAVAAYLCIRGFHLEHMFSGITREIKESMRSKKAAFFLYFSSMVLGVIGIYQGYAATLTLEQPTLFSSLAIFVHESVYMLFLAEIVAWIGWLAKHPADYKKTLVLPILGFSTTFLLFTASEVVLVPERGLSNFIVSILLGFLLVVTTIVVGWGTRRGK